LPYMAYTGGYVKIFPGNRSTDAVAGDTHNTLTSKTFDYETNKYYSLFVIGTEGDYENVIVNDGLDTLQANKGNTYFRFINAISDKTPVTSKVANDTADLLSQEAAYGEVAPFTALDSGAVTISITDNNTINVERDVQLESQKAYTFLISGNPNS